MINIGTCSWTEKTLIQSGDFYPKEIRTAEGRLRYYANYFDTVEAMRKMLRINLFLENRNPK